MQLQIIYHEQDADIAQKIQNDIAETSLRLDHPIVLVLLSPTAVLDSAIQAEIEQSKQKNNLLAPIMLHQTTVPDALKDAEILNLTKKYDKVKLITFIKRMDITRDQRKNNQRLLFVIGGLVLTMFVIGFASIAAGIVAFPVDEYATENAIRDQQVATLVAPDIEELRPRTTEDALNFQLTLDAVRNDDLLPFIEGTATAIPQQIEATNQARQTQAFGTEAAQTQAAGE
ncbi:MAG: hypothetical protein WBC91_02140 [Phototrophicaceae bacterium]